MLKTTSDVPILFCRVLLVQRMREIISDSNEIVEDAWEEDEDKRSSVYELPL